jgi:hypothetical protein
MPVTDVVQVHRERRPHEGVRDALDVLTIAHLPMTARLQTRCWPRYRLCGDPFGCVGQRRRRTTQHNSLASHRTPVKDL